jgi:polyisoprenyl-phosphate glycosyltransferase
MQGPATDRYVTGYEDTRRHRSDNLHNAGAGDGWKRGASTLSTKSSGGVRRRPLISVVTCAYNESGCVDELARRLKAMFSAMPEYDFEVIAIENGSEDDTFERLVALQREDRRFHVVQLARNFRFDGGLTAGIALARGDAVVLMAADLQDPPEVIPRFIELWEEGYENIYGVVGERRGTSPLRKLNSRLFYWLIGRMADHPIPANARDFRLLDRKLYEQIQQMNEHSRFIRGLASWPGFRSVGVEFDQPERFAGESKATSGGVSEFAIRAIFANSLAPLKLLPFVGALMVIGSGLALIALFIYWVIAGVPFPGFGAIIATSILVFGLLATLLSIIGIYVGLIFEEVRNRPNFVVREIVSEDLFFNRTNENFDRTRFEITTRIGARDEDNSDSAIRHRQSTRPVEIARPREQ